MSQPGLRRFLAPPVVDPVELCEMCATEVPAEHPHVVNVESRQILCACRGCYLLFTEPGAGKFRAVPDRLRYVPALAGGDRLWEAVGIPVGMAFFFTNSGVGKPVAFYPSPAGATESLLSLETWSDVLAANPAFADVRDDVEALLMRRTDSAVECFLVPVDVCYQLVGLVKLWWRGFDGGTEARERIDAFFEDLTDRADHA